VPQLVPQPSRLQALLRAECTLKHGLKWAQAAAKSRHSSRTVYGIAEAMP